MLRVPAPATGARITGSIHHELDAAIALNPAVHDGAIILGRSQTYENYTIRGWSYRLLPPENAAAQEENRGSAFNSGLAMSIVEGVDAVYLLSSIGFSKFIAGYHIRLV